MSGTMPEPPPTSNAGSCRPTEPTADRATHFDLVADLEYVVQIGRRLAVVQAFDGELDLVGAIGRRRDRVRTVRGVAVGHGEANDEV